MSVEMLYIIGFVIVGVAIAFGIMRSSRRNKANDPISQAATKELYQHPARYEERTQNEMQDQIKP